ncbi:hypothetical protein [Sphaerisporangium krabiense]|uniref:Uncharacterized protein n=1 Tax=Sphaerisporangium krabiense TaxID=763782 RepID=A0A7W9DR54_9ACTN|nr:hypothetical protein [Sphaerisporangium krabiense]MBB5627729.1 hypothetical protein [Sphaerisporangium krabiense]
MAVIQAVASLLAGALSGQGIWQLIDKMSAARAARADARTAGGNIPLAWLSPTLGMLTWGLAAFTVLLRLANGPSAEGSVAQLRTVIEWSCYLAILAGSLVISVAARKNRDDIPLGVIGVLAASGALFAVLTAG